MKTHQIFKLNISVSSTQFFIFISLNVPVSNLKRKKEIYVIV